MQLVKKKLSDIFPYENNPRKNDRAVATVMESIRQCEYIAPIIVDEDGVILAGHTRYKALQKMGWTEAECIVKEGLAEEQKRKYRLLDNKTNEFAGWDFDLLEVELEGMDFEGFDFGFGVDVYPLDEELEDSEELPDKTENPVEVRIRFNSARDLQKHENELRELVDTFGGVNISVGEADAD